MPSLSDELARLGELRDRGVLTQVEFEEQKAKLLGNNTAASEPPTSVSAPPARKSGWRTGCLYIVGAFVVLLILGLIFGGGDKTPVTAPSPDNAAATSPDNAAAPAVDNSEPAVTEAAEEAPSLSLAGYNRVKNGMRYRQVVAIIGEPSQEITRSDLGGIETVMYQWDGSLGANMNAMFQDGRLVQKAQFGLR